jgi:hypothetical protein
MKIKCVKLQCPVCSNHGSCRIFFNSKNEIRYARVRHAISKRSKDYNTNRKYNFNYCKIEDLQQLETLLKTLNLQFPTVKAPTGHKVADQTEKTIDHGQIDSSSISKNMWAGSSARIEHHPPKVEVVGSNPTPPVGDTPRTVLETQNDYFLFLKIFQLL